MFYFVVTVAVIINIIFYNFFESNFKILSINILFFSILAILISKQKKIEFLEKKNLDINYSSELEKKELEKLFIDKI